MFETLQIQKYVSDQDDQNKTLLTPSGENFFDFFEFPRSFFKFCARFFVKNLNPKSDTVGTPSPKAARR